MTKSTLCTLAGVFMIGASTVVWAHPDAKSMQKPPSPEFQQLKQLVGTWQGTTTPMGPNEKTSPVNTEFRLTAAGSAVEETLLKGMPNEMVDMYADENGQLTMKHYCAMGNQPHMAVQPGAAHTLQFVMTPTPGIAPNDSHMHALTLEFPDADHLTERWTNYTDGKPSEKVVFTMTRVKS